MQEEIHHGDTEGTEMLEFFVCRESTANENCPSCLRQEACPFFLSEDSPFLPIVACRAIALTKADLPMGKKL